jgi:hypothetical protein
LRHHVVELNRAALPFPPERVSDVKIDFRSVKGAVPLVDPVGLLRAIERLLQGGFGMIPGGDLAEELLGPR